MRSNLRTKALFAEDINFFVKNVTKDDSYSWEQFLLSADSDFVSVTTLSFFGMLDFTSLWMVAHSIEKYTKAYLLKNNNAYDPRSDGHHIEKLWNKFIAKASEMNELPYTQPTYYLNFIREVDKYIKINMRYNHNGTIVNMVPFSTTFNEIGFFCRKIILGADFEQQGRYYGIGNSSFGGNVTGLSDRQDIDIKVYLKEYMDKLFLHQEIFFKFNNLVSSLGGKEKFLNHMNKLEYLISKLKEKKEDSYNPYDDFISIISATLNPTGKVESGELDRIIGEIGGEEEFDSYIDCIRKIFIQQPGDKEQFFINIGLICAFLSLSSAC